MLQGSLEPVSTRLTRRALRRTFQLESGLRRTLPRNDRGHELDPATGALLRGMARLDPPDGLRPVGIARREYDELGPLVDLPPAPMHRIEDHEFDAGSLLPDTSSGRLRARIYRPVRAAQPAPAVVYFHGGGFVIGSLRSHEGAITNLAALTHAVFIAIDYRLAPEFRAPAAHDDALTAYVWVRTNAAALGIDPERILLAGDSAGGALTLSTGLSVRDRGLPAPRGLLPIYPLTDCTGRLPSRRELGHGFLLTRELVDWFAARFLVDRNQERDPRLSPLLATHVRDLPRTHIVTAGFDPLRDEGEAMVTRLREAGVAVSHTSEDRLIHGFLTLGGVVPEAERAVGRVGEAIAAMLY